MNDRLGGPGCRSALWLLTVFRPRRVEGRADSVSMSAFTDRIDRAVANLERRRDTPDPGMAGAATATSSSDLTPPKPDELDRIETDLDILFSIRAGVEPPHPPCAIGWPRSRTDTDCIHLVRERP